MTNAFIATSPCHLCLPQASGLSEEVMTPHPELWLHPAGAPLHLADEDDGDDDVNSL